MNGKNIFERSRSINRFLLFAKYLEDPQVSSFLPKKKSSFSKAKTASCPQYSEAPVGSDEFVLDVLQFFFEERLNPNQLNERLRQVAADALWRATEGSDATDLVPRPPDGKPGIVWLVSQAVQIAFRKARNRCIYEAIRLVVKAALRSEYEFAKIGAEAQSYAAPLTSNLTTSNQGIDFIKQFEVFSSNLYNDPVGHCTIGYGTLIHRGNCNGSESDEFRAGISEQRATELLKQEIGRIEGVINTNVVVSLSQSQFDSLVSFAYNVGTGAFKKSTLLKKLNQSDYVAVPVELKKWIKGGGKTLPGLVRRRASEANMFTDGTYSTSNSFSLGQSDQNFDVKYDVQLIPQLTDKSCWAAGAAMLIGWRDRISINPSDVAARIGYWAQYTKDGLNAEDQTMFRVWGLTPEPAQTYTIEGFKQLLERYGPLWVASAEPGPHIRVVTGMSGDGTPDGTIVYINDPWQQGMDPFSLPNAGSQYSESYRTFVIKQSDLGYKEKGLQGIYVAHCASFSQGQTVTRKQGANTLKSGTYSSSNSLYSGGLDTTPRGIRNNNPGNIEINRANDWEGRVKREDNTDGRFEQFVSYEYGVRALIILLRNYIKSGRNTITKVFAAYAPPSENDTKEYIRFVSGRINIGPEEELPINKQVLKELSQSIGKMENGKDCITDEQFESGWTLVPESIRSTILTLSSSQAAEQPYFDIRTCQSDADFNTKWAKIKSKIVQIANDEYTFWTKADGSRYQETDSFVTSRLQGYWSATGRNVTVAQCQDPNWQSQNPWSAAFISWVMSQAGAENSFNYSALHMTYVYAAKQNTVNKNQDNPFWLCSVNNALPEPGDLICRNRGSSNFTYENVQASGASHCDIVVEVDYNNSRMFVTGGNKNPHGNTGTVDKEEIRLTGNGLVDLNYGSQNKIFAVLKLRTDKCDTCGTIAVV